MRRSGVSLERLSVQRHDRRTPKAPLGRQSRAHSCPGRGDAANLDKKWLAPPLTVDLG